MTSNVVNVSLMCELALRGIRMIIVALCFESRLSLQSLQSGAAAGKVAGSNFA
jgi:hypothetical protein